MAKRKCIGIHYCGSTVTAVVVERSGTSTELIKRIKVPVEAGASSEPEVAALGQLADELRRGEQKLPLTAVALGGEFYQSEFHHSDFADTRQLAQTLRFDVEEEFMIDAEAAAICYQRQGDTDSGSDLIVHVAKRDHLEHLLPHFEQVGLDALACQPDVACWLTYLKKQGELPKGEPVMVVAWAAGTLYIVMLDAGQRPILARSYHCDSDEHAQVTLTSELRRSLASLATGQFPSALYYHTQGFSDERIDEISKATGLPCRALAEADATEAFAYGAALACLDADSTADFRGDGLPPRSLITANRKALLGLSAAISILLLLIGIVLKAHDRRYETMKKESSAAVLAAWKETNPSQRLPKRSVSGELKRQRKELQARGGSHVADLLPTSAGQILTLALQRLELLPKDFGLRIKLLNISVKNHSAILSGSVPNLEDMDTLEAVFSGEDSLLTASTWEFDTGGSGRPDDVSNQVAFTLPLRVQAKGKEASNGKK